MCNWRRQVSTNYYWIFCGIKYIGKYLSSADRPNFSKVKSNDAIYILKIVLENGMDRHYDTTDTNQMENLKNDIQRLSGVQIVKEKLYLDALVYSN